MKPSGFFGWVDLLDIEFGKNHLLQADSFISKMSEYVAVDFFEDLKMPLKVVAADFWQRQEVVFSTGPLIPAVSASFCLPGVFEPVLIDGKVLVDGGCVNPVPFDLLQEMCDIVIAVDVAGHRVPDDDLLPSFSEALFNTFQIASSAIAKEKMKRNPADIYLAPAIKDVKVLEFDKFEQIDVQTKPECDRLVTELTRLLD